MTAESIANSHQKYMTFSGPRHSGKLVLMNTPRRSFEPHAMRKQPVRDAEWAISAKFSCDGYRATFFRKLKRI
jgi:hypothetical protein